MNQKNIILFALNALVLAFLIFGQNENDSQQTGSTKGQKKTEIRPFENKESSKYHKDLLDQVDKNSRREMVLEKRKNRLLDFHMDFEDIYKRKDKFGHDTMAVALIKELKNCILAQQCIEQQGDIESYRANQTIAYQRLNRLLNYFATYTEKTGLYPNALPFQDLIEVVAIDNVDTQLYALTLLVNYPDFSKEEFRSLMGQNDKFFARAKAELFAFANEYAQKNPSVKDDFTKILNDAFNKSDTHSKMKILEGLHRFHLNEDEILIVQKSVCAYKSNPAQEHSYKRMNYYVREYAQSKGLAVADCP